MMLGFGPHASNSVELLVLKEPDDVVWMLGQTAKSGYFAAAQREILRLIRRFDEKAFIVPCQTPECGNRVTRCTVYHGAVWPRWWCDDCDPFCLGASADKLWILKGYADAVNYVHAACGGRKASLKALVKEMAQAKGLPARVGEAQAPAFFR